MAKSASSQHSQDIDAGIAPTGHKLVRCPGCGQEHMCSQSLKAEKTPELLIDFGQAKDEKQEVYESETMETASSVDPLITGSDDPRCIILVGKPGSGKRTIVKEGLFPGMDVFTTVSSSSDGNEVTQPKKTIEYQGKKYSVLLIEDLNLMRQYRKNPKVAQSFSKKYGGKIASDVLLIMFVYRHGRFTQEEKDVFDLAISCFTDNAQLVCALVITNCENLSSDAKQEAKMEFKTNASTKNISNFMGKGIHCVGFPDVESSHPGVKQAYQIEIENSRKVMQGLLLKDQEKYIDKMEVMKPVQSRSIPPRGVHDSHQQGTLNCQIM